MLTWGSFLAGRVFAATVLTGVILEDGLCVLCIAELVSLLLLHLRLSMGCYRSWLMEHGVYELGLSLGERAIAWYLVIIAGCYRFLILTWGIARLSSVEGLFRSARWLERESAEMHDLWFLQKRDRRALFLVPLLYWAPLQKSFPVTGFFELRLQAHEGRLYAYHISWLD